ncbi:MAG: DUF5915 domain-containing protein, partial [Chlorobiaceae bacterium]
GPDKIAAYQTLYHALVTLSKLLAPFTPFLAERMYLNLNGISHLESCKSVHLADFPMPDLSAIDRPLEQRMKKAQIITSLVRTMREKASIKVRQPLKRILLAVSDAAAREEYRLVSEIIMEEVNVHKIEYIEDEGSVISKKVKPNFKTLGPRFGKEMKALAEAVRIMSHKQIAVLEKEGQLVLELDGRVFDLVREDVEIMHEDIEGWLVASDEANGIMVALDTEMTEELEMQGDARELVSRIQTDRKGNGFAITDRINIYINTSSQKLLDAIEANEAYIKEETLALSLGHVMPHPGILYSINGHECELLLEKCCC